MESLSPDSQYRSSKPLELPTMNRRSNKAGTEHKGISESNVYNVEIELMRHVAIIMGRTLFYGAFGGVLDRQFLE